jgi:ferredoxin--NADP+ reductase
MANTSYDLVIIGGTAGGLSVAISGRRAGVGLIRVVEEGQSVTLASLVGENELDVGYGEAVQSITLDDDVLVVTTTKQQYRTHACLVANRAQLPVWDPPIKVEATGRIHVDDLSAVGDSDDVLVVGNTDHAVELTVAAASIGARVVLAAGGLDPTRLSPAGDNALRRLERDRRATVLYRSMPDAVSEVDGFPMAFFDDRRTPDLQFDHIVFASPRANLGPADVGLADDALATGRVWFLGEPTGDEVAPTAPGWRVALDMARAVFPHVEINVRPSAELRRRHTGAIEELRGEHYNATITHFEPTHSDLWVLRVKPDDGDTSYLPGQYATLGLGYWEDRVDDAVDPDIDAKWDKLIRRSYSISCRMFDDHGYLIDENAQDELEFYIVLVSPTEDNIPGLTPRLALKRPGDRIYLGAKVAGRYTLSAVKDPTDTIIFLATGTGEAPHNGMSIELLRKGHVGPIVSAVSVRNWADLGYIDHHRTLEARYPNYHYVPLPTREPDVPKRYIQDLIGSGAFENEIGVELDPEHTHVFLCGNPSMIGLPETVDGEEHFPETVGAVQLLVERGFKLDRRNDPGNIHYEEYW